MHTLAAAAPVGQSDRIAIIDSLRGIAILGILLMNIPFFSMPEPSTDNPGIFHETGIDLRVWYIIDWIFDGTQRALFGMLFGAGILLFLSKLENKLPGMAPADYLIRRNLWLIVFGLIDGYVLLWSGDVLFTYGIAGIILFVFRKVNPRRLVIASAACLVLMTVRENVGLYRSKLAIRKGESIARIDTARTKLTEQQKEALGAMTSLKDRADSAALIKETAKTVRHIQGDYPTLYNHISNETADLEVSVSYYWIWDSLVFMFLGMAFFKTGVLTGTASLRIYWWMTIGGLALGLLLNYAFMQQWIGARFNTYIYSRDVAGNYYEITRVLRSIGLFGLIMLMYRSGWFNWFFGLMRPVGQMAFTNYLMQSILCGLFFYGIGWGMFGRLQRHEIYYVVGVVWLLEIIWSHLWLRYFRFGPFEWLWRSLTYWKRQPMKR
jgi:uncharacterized protein